MEKRIAQYAECCHRKDPQARRFDRRTGGKPGADSYSYEYECWVERRSSMIAKAEHVMRLLQFFNSTRARVFFYRQYRIFVGE